MSDEMAAAVLARALGDAVNPDRPVDTAYLGDALFFPVVLRTLELLADRGYLLVRTEGRNTP